MNVKELKAILEQYPDDMDIWVSDQGNSEGGERLKKVEAVLAFDAALDGDSIDDEYIYVDEDTNVIDLQTKGYYLTDNDTVLSKKILYLNDF